MERQKLRMGEMEMEAYMKLYNISSNKNYKGLIEIEKEILRIEADYGQFNFLTTSLFSFNNESDEEI